MSVGLPVTKNEVDSRSGDTARLFQRAFEDAATMQLYLEGTANADLEAMGYTPQEVSILKSAYNDLTFLGQVWIGQQASPALKDFRTFVRLLWGVGAF